MDSVDALDVVNDLSSFEFSAPLSLEFIAVISVFSVVAEELSLVAMPSSVERMDAMFVPTLLVTSFRLSVVPLSWVIMLSVWEISVLTVEASASIFGLTFVA